MTTVVLIEDDPTLRLMYRHMFERYFSCTVVEAADGSDGLRLIGEHKPHLVVLDIHLPTVSGVDVLQAMRSNPETAQIPAIAITSENQRATIEQLVQGRVLDILLKPVVLARDLPRLQKVFARITGAGGHPTPS